MRGHNVCFYGTIKKISLLPLESGPLHIMLRIQRLESKQRWYSSRSSSGYALFANSIIFRALKVLIFAIYNIQSSR